MKKRNLLFVVYCLLFTATAQAQVLSLDSILSRIEKNNPALLSYTNKINSANELVNSAKAWEPPMVGVQIGQNPYSFDLKNNTYQAMLVAQQWIPNGKKITAHEDYLKSFAPIEQNEYGYLKNQFFGQAKEKYYERYITERKIQILNNNIALMKNMITISEKQMANGMGDLGSIYKIKARLAEAETMLLHETNMAKTLTVELNYLMSSDLKQTFPLDTSNLVKDYRSKFLLYTKDSLELIRSDIQKMTSEITTMKFNQTAMSYKSKPEYGVKYEHTTTFGNGGGMYAAMFMMTVPVVPWSSRGYKSEVKAMSFQIDAMEQDKLAMINMANNTVNMLILEWNTEYFEVDNYTKKVIPAYQKSLDANLLAYSQNTGDLMKVILALDDLQMARMEYLNHLGILLNAQADYEKELQIR